MIAHISKNKNLFGKIMDAPLVFDIVHDWTRENHLLRRKKYMNHFNSYFSENCSNSDILHLRYESSCDGTFEILHYLAQHSLKLFGLDFGDETHPKKAS